MAKRKYTRRKKPQPTSSSGPAWLILGLLLGFGIAIVMNWEPVINYAAKIIDSTQTAQTKEQPKQAKKQAAKPEFDFYNMLANKKVEPPKAPKPATPPANKIPAPQVTQAPQSYVVQLASFSNYQDADRLRAQLTMTGLDVYIQTVQQNGGTLYRIYTGPYDSRGLAENQQTELRRQNIDSILLKQ